MMVHPSLKAGESLCLFISRGLLAMLCEGFGRPTLREYLSFGPVILGRAKGATLRSTMY